MPFIDFAGQSSQDVANIPASSSRLINCYREPVSGRGKSDVVLKSVLGMSSFCDLDDPAGRAVEVVNGKIYAIAGANLYSVDVDGNAIDLGGVTDDPSPTMAGYGANVLLSSGADYKVWNGTTLSSVTGGAFTSVGSVAYIGGYGVLTESDGSRFEWTELQDVSTRNALHVKSAEGRDDVLLRAFNIGGRLALFGERSIEVWYVSGQAGANAFKRTSGGVLERGLKAKGLLTSIDGAAFFIGNDNVPYILSGSTLAPLYNTGLQSNIEASTPTNCFYYEDQGHKFAVVRFSDRPAWVFDLATREWHERAEGTSFEAWGALGAVKAYGSWYVLDAEAVVSKLSRTNADNGSTLIRRIIGNTIEMNGDPFAPTFEVRCRRGHQSEEIDLIGAFSQDGGETWSDPVSVSVGGLGNFDQRAIWYEGVTESFTPRIDIAAAFEVPIYSTALVELN